MSFNIEFEQRIWKKIKKRLLASKVNPSVTYEDDAYNDLINDLIQQHEEEHEYLRIPIRKKNEEEESFKNACLDLDSAKRHLEIMLQQKNSEHSFQGIDEKIEWLKGFIKFKEKEEGCELDVK